MLAPRLCLLGAGLAIAALACIASAACSGKAGSCNVAPCGRVQPAAFGFLCSQQSPSVPPYDTYATIVRTVVEGSCTASCEYPEDGGSCELVMVSATDAGTCHVQVTSSTGAVVPLTYEWKSDQVDDCAGCFTLDLVDSGSSPTPTLEDCGVQSGLDGSGDD